MNGSQGPRLDQNPASGADFRGPVPPLGKKGAVGLVLALLPILTGLFLVLREVPVDVRAPGTLLGLVLGGGGWWLALRAARGAAPGADSWSVLWAGALALRLLCLAREPGLSDDVHRYVWEGALVAERADPYGTAPSEPARAAERDRWGATYASMNHPEVPAAYPPLTLLVQGVLVQAAGGAEDAERARFLLRTVFGLCDLFVCVPLAWLLRKRRASTATLVAWAWNPWVALEFAGSGHFDALGILLLVTTLALASRPFLAGTLLALGALTKLLPLALVPTLMRRAPRPTLLGLALGALVPLLVWLVWVGAWPVPRGLAEYAFRWESFSLVHRWSEAAFARLSPYDESLTDPRRLARALAGVAWLALLAFAWVRRFEPERVALVALAGFLVLTPTLHPWYVCWIVPFLALFRARSCEWLVAVAPLLYWPLGAFRAGGAWVEPAWLWPLVTLPFAAALVVDLRRVRTVR